MGHWGLKCCGGKPPPPSNAPLTKNAPPTGSQYGKSRCPPGCHSCHPGRGGMTDAIDVGEDHSPQDEIVLYGIQADASTVATTCTKVNAEEAPTYKKLFIDAIDYWPVGDTHPEKIVVDDVCAPWCNEAYTMVQLPASASRKGTASLHVKVNTGAGGNVLPLCIFKCLCPNWISPAALPTSLDHMSTRLTAHNRSHIPLYGALHGPITWQPGSPGAWPCRVHSYWYVADTSGPAILGLPSCKRLAVVKMNCAVTVAQPDTKPPSSVPAPTVTVDKSIKSTDDLIKEFPDQFTGIGRFPGEYTIWLCHDVHPIIHAPRKYPIALCPKVNKHFNKIECMGVITNVDQPTDWVFLNHLCPESKWWAISVFRSPWPQRGHLLQSPQDAHCGGSCPWICALTLLHKVGCLPWILVNHLWSGIQPTHNLQQPLWMLPFPVSCIFPLALSVLKTSSRRRWTRS